MIRTCQISEKMVIFTFPNLTFTAETNKIITTTKIPNTLCPKVPVLQSVLIQGVEGVVMGYVKIGVNGNIFIYAHLQSETEGDLAGAFTAGNLYVISRFSLCYEL